MSTEEKTPSSPASKETFSVSVVTKAWDALGTLYNLQRDTATTQAKVTDLSKALTTVARQIAVLDVQLKDNQELRERVAKLEAQVEILLSDRRG